MTTNAVTGRKRRHRIYPEFDPRDLDALQAVAGGYSPFTDQPFYLAHAVRVAVRIAAAALEDAEAVQTLAKRAGMLAPGSSGSVWAKVRHRGTPSNTSVGQ